MWATGEEHVRVLAFMCIRKSLTLQPNLFEFVLKVSHNLSNNLAVELLSPTKLRLLNSTTLAGQSYAGWIDLLSKYTG